MPCRRNEWSPVRRGDEYAEDGDTHFIDTAAHSYYWNQRRKVTRRYTLADHSYCEIRNQRMPPAAGSSGLFSLARRERRLRAVEVDGVAA